MAVAQRRLNAEQAGETGGLARAGGDRRAPDAPEETAQRAPEGPEADGGGRARSRVHRGRAREPDMPPSWTRRRFTQAGLAAAACATDPKPAARDSAAAAATPQGVVFITADDLGWRDLSSYGLTSIATPNIDRHVTEGVAFSRCFDVVSTCSSSRATYVTGQYPHTHGVTGLVLPFDRRGGREVTQKRPSQGWGGHPGARSRRTEETRRLHRATSPREVPPGRAPGRQGPAGAEAGVVGRHHGPCAHGRGARGAAGLPSPAVGTRNPAGWRGTAAGRARTAKAGQPGPVRRRPGLPPSLAPGSPAPPAKATPPPTRRGSDFGGRGALQVTRKRPSEGCRSSWMPRRRP